uniref:Uncharacterized protein n=1 Tax=Octopus bimaculoides TaxID=37653 RepID=A0A0L8FRX1_OCTBM
MVGVMLCSHFVVNGGKTLYSMRTANRSITVQVSEMTMQRGMIFNSELLIFVSICKLSFILCASIHLYVGREHAIHFLLGNTICKGLVSYPGVYLLSKSTLLISL